VLRLRPECVLCLWWEGQMVRTSSKLITAKLFLLSVSLALAGQNVPDAPAPKVPATGQFPGDAPPAAKNDHPAEPAATPESTPSGNPELQQRPPGLTTDKKELPVFVVHTNFVLLPVIVKDNSGKLVSGLNWQDFTVYEDGAPQKLN